MESIQKPLLSVVATSRNDDHGGNALWRTQHFVNGLAAQALRFEFPIELVLVDWNPLSDKKSLFEALDWSKENPYFSYRVIQVPADYHNKFKFSDKLPLFQYLAKNVGIKRAKGEYILSTNIDILFSDELIQSLKSSLKPNFLYGVDRYDTNLKDDVSPNLPFEEVLKLAEQNVVRANMHLGTTSSKFFIGKKFIFKIYMYFLSFILSIRIFLRYFFIKAPYAIISAFLHPSSLLSNAKNGVIRFYKDGKKYLRFLKNTLFGSPMTSLHTNACGDFTLLSKKDWEKLRGYPEWELYSWHIDSVLVYQAHHNDIKMYTLPTTHSIFHIEHGKGSGWTPEGAKLLFERLDKQGIGYMSDNDLEEEFEKQRKLQKQGKAVVYNDDNWGGSDTQFPERGSL